VSALARLLGDLLHRVRGRGTERSAARTPDAAEVGALFQRCVQLSKNAGADAAADCYGRLLHLDPSHAKAHNNLGVLHQRRGDFQAAARCFEDAVRLDPALSEPHVNLGNLHDIRGDPDRAVSCYRRALQIDPGYAHAHCCLAQALLATGRYEEGWEEFEWRWRGEDASLRLPPFPQPLWDGSQDIAGKRVLLHAEQGYGDGIQFIRYAPLLAARGARVVALCDPALAALFRSVPGVESVGEPGEPLAEFDYHAPLMSLPRAFRTTVTTIPAPIPYVAPDPAAVATWRTRLSAHPAPLKVGLAWAGRPTFVAAAMKASPLNELAPLADTPGCDFFSLQKGEAAADLREPGAWRGRITDYTADLHDFGDTAALVAALDLVISIDTAAAHLAGALGKPVWLLLAAVPDWRWLPRAGALAWYPTATLFRQSTEGDWKSVVEEVRTALVERASAA
jgi:hypothetical protein